MTQIATVGSIIHYYPGVDHPMAHMAPFAALVTHCPPCAADHQVVNLQIFLPCTCGYNPPDGQGVPFCGEMDGDAIADNHPHITGQPYCCFPPRVEFTPEPIRGANPNLGIIDEDAAPNWDNHSDVTLPPGAVPVNSPRPVMKSVATPPRVLDDGSHMGVVSAQQEPGVSTEPSTPLLADADPPPSPTEVSGETEKPAQTETGPTT